MKKLSNDKRLYLKAKQQNIKKDELRKASAIKAEKLKINSKLLGLSGTVLRLHIERTKFRRNFFKNRSYTNPAKTVCIEGSFGLENKDNIDSFLNKASEIIDFNNKELKFDLSKCTRMWPSAVTLLCSLEQWVELSTWNKKIKPSLASTKSVQEKVNSYLYHCGFNDYVGINTIEKTDYYSDKEIVKIRREKNTSNVEDREDEILCMIDKFTEYNKDQKRLLHAKILIETFNNVTEHGVSGYDNGWWVLAQYHPAHGLISINIADNGIGIKNSLVTGPQKDMITQSFPISKLNDGELIRRATETRISGALKAATKGKDKFYSKSKYPLGSKRGNGLDRIKSGCKELGIELTLLSHFGFLSYSPNGDEFRCGTMPRRIFAGTLYHLNVPARKGIIL